MPSFSRALHMALTVRDMRVSADWYQRVLGFELVKEFQVAPGDAGIPGSCCSISAAASCSACATTRAAAAMPLTHGAPALITSPSRWQTALSSPHG